jgi:hypothetical protein
MDVSVNYKQMSSVTYSALRQLDWYTSQPRSVHIEDRRFWCLEQLYIYEDIFVPMSKPIRPMHPIDLAYLKSKEYFVLAVQVVERLGLTGLMTLQCDYDPKLILQFYATVAFTGDDDRTFKWMTGTRYYESSFTRFASLLGYPFDGPTNPVGHRIHTPLPVNHNLLCDLYGPKGNPGHVAGLLPLYDLLVRIFRENIAPSGGNNDAIRSSLVDLLIYAHGCAQSTDPGRDFTLDVMDFIFNEMFDAMVSKGSLPYAPFIMRLIKDTFKEQDFSAQCVPHKVKRLYVKQSKPAPVAPVALDSFMRDTRSSAPRGKFVSKDVPKRLKRLSWFQKHVLCMKVEIHRENYDAYRERKTILDTQREILHKLSGEQAALSPPTPPIAYNEWHTDTYDWGAMEQSVYVGRTSRGYDEEEEFEEDFDDEEEEEEEGTEDDFEEDENDDDDDFE